MNIQKIKKKMINELNLEDVIIQQEGNFYQVVVFGEVFSNLNKLKQHKKIYNYFFKYIINNQIHSLSIKVYSKRENWIKTKNKNIK